MQPTLSHPHIDIAGLIAAGAVETYLQPIASMRRQGLIGVEALTRCQVEGTPVPPPELFGAAERAGLAADLDRLCRRRAIQCFRALHARQPELVLFVNCHPSTLTEAPDALDGWSSLARRYGVDPRNVAVEISEEAMEDPTAARVATRALREAGFLVVLDDVGVKSANLDRIAQIQPDIIKADRALVSGVGDDYHQREVLRSLVHLSERLGGWVIAEGVETADEAVTVAEMGGDMVQGYLLGRPRRADPDEAVHWDESRMGEVARRFRERRLGTARALRTRREQRSALVLAVAAGLQRVGEGDLDAALARLIEPHSSILSAAVLDERGVQITGSVLNPMRFLRQKTIIFAPPPRGADHSLKEYFYLLVGSEAAHYESPPYVPLPTGDLAVTLSTRFEAGDARRVLALHVRAEPGDLAP